MYTVPKTAKMLSKLEIGEIESRHADFRNKYESRGVLLNGAGLSHRSQSNFVGAPAEELSTPEASGPEITAYYVVDCTSVNEAKEVAQELLDDHVIAVEIREIHHSSGMDKDKDK